VTRLHYVYVITDKDHSLNMDKFAIKKNWTYNRRTLYDYYLRDRSNIYTINYSILRIRN